MIDPQTAAFLQEGLGIHIGTRNERLEPSGARAAAATVTPDGCHLDVYLPRVWAPEIVPNLEANGQAAVVFARPVDDRSCQVKGEFVSVRPAAARERALVAAQWDGFLGTLEQIGIPRGVTARWVTWPAVVIRLRATAVFDQTPGPKAGTPLS